VIIGKRGRRNVREGKRVRFNPYGLVGVMLVAAASVAIAADAASLIKQRQAHYKQIGAASKGIHDELNKPTPDAAVIQGFARQIDGLAPQIPTWFPKGTGPEAGVKTAAKPEIWTNPTGFAQAASGFAAEAHKFDGVAQGGNVDAIRAEYVSLGKACFTCHSQFRAKE
jgi:cytochrome c556